MAWLMDVTRSKSVPAESDDLLEGVCDTRLERDVLVQEDAKSLGAINIPVRELLRPTSQFGTTHVFNLNATHILLRALRCLKSGEMLLDKLSQLSQSRK